MIEKYLNLSVLLDVQPVCPRNFHREALWVLSVLYFQHSTKSMRSASSTRPHDFPKWSYFHHSEKSVQPDKFYPIFELFYVISDFRHTVPVPKYGTTLVSFCHFTMNISDRFCFVGTDRIRSIDFLVSFLVAVKAQSK